MDFPFEKRNTGFEGLSAVRRKGRDYLLALCEGNRCRAGRRERNPAAGASKCCSRPVRQTEVLHAGGIVLAVAARLRACLRPMQDGRRQPPLAEAGSGDPCFSNSDPSPPVTSALSGAAAPSHQRAFTPLRRHDGGCCASSSERRRSQQYCSSPAAFRASLRRGRSALHHCRGARPQPAIPPCLPAESHSDWFPKPPEVLEGVFLIAQATGRAAGRDHPNANALQSSTIKVQAGLMPWKPLVEAIRC